MRILAMAALVSLVTSPAFAAVSGDWAGDLKFPQGTLRFVLHITGPDNDLRATADSPDQKAGNLPVDAIRLDGDTLSFRMTQLDVRFTGRVSASEIRGTFTQGTVDVPLILTRQPAKSDANGQRRGGPSIDGDWQGLLAYPSQTLHFVLHITGADNALQATADSPDQNSYRIPVDSIVRNGQSLRFSIARLKVTFTGAISAGEIRGTFSQNGHDVPLTLKRP